MSGTESSSAPDPRAEMRCAFLARHGLGWQKPVPIAGDFSARRYFRFADWNDDPVILMDDPQPGSAASFVTVAKLLTVKARVSAPRIFAADLDHGFLLIEDFGEQGFGKLLSAGEDEQAFYEIATDALIEIHQQITPADCRAAGLPIFDRARLCEQVMVFADLYIPAARNGLVLTKDARAELEESWTKVLDSALSGLPESLLLRDYHVDNLMWLPKRAGFRRAGLLDFQDAGLGSVAYDLVSLLEDARRDVSGTLAAAMQGRYKAAFPAIDWAQFVATYHILGAQRHCRILARILHVGVTEGKQDKLALLPRVMSQFRTKLARPELAPVAHWFARHFDLSAPLQGAA